MPSLAPFPALRPRPELASRICELPYDVMSSAEARLLAEGNPLSFLRVSKPEIELDPATDPYAPEVYARGRDNLAALMNQGHLIRDDTPCYYLYRQIMNGRAQVGVVGLASCQEYLDGTVKKHEFTRPDKEDDRVRHIETLNAQTGPVFLTYRAHPGIDALVARIAASDPLVDFTAPDGIRHSAWIMNQDEDIDALKNAFASVPAFYIADGHHRSAAAARVFQSRHGGGGSAGFLSVVFAHDQLRILPYNRALKNLNGHTAAELVRKLENVFEISETKEAEPARKHELGLYLAGRWRRLIFRTELTSRGTPADLLDVALLQSHVLAPVFGINDPRTSQNISFVGGIRGTSELESLVDSGDFACAFAMFPTGIDDLMSIADLGGIMPPKSTWFEPKLRDAMFSHLL